MFPVWLNFRGGKGVATGLGSFVVISPHAVLMAAAIYLVLVLLFRYSALTFNGHRARGPRGQLAMQATATVSHD